MGLNVELYAEGDFTQDQVAQADAYILARSFHLPDPEYNDGKALRVYPHAPNRVHLHTLERYYGPGYERGDWPTIYGGIRLMRAAFPHARILYGSDAREPGEMDECTEEFLADVWAHFLGPEGNNYRAVNAAWNAMREAARKP